jgi:phage host-nuclease inhibitor protein Gam
MDDRKKRIGELEHRKREHIVQLDALLIRLGEGVFGRMADLHTSGIAELAVYQGYQIDIANSQASIQSVEEQIRRSKELDQNIDAAELGQRDNAKELAAAYSRLGKILLNENSEQYAGFSAAYRDQNEALLTKVSSLGERLDELEKKEGGNVFTWIGKGAQSLVLRGFMTKAQESLEQLRRNVGECYIRDHNAPEDGSMGNNTGIEALCAEIAGKRARSDTLSSDIAVLKEERRKINSSFSAEGGPVKHINTIKNHIADVQNELKALYRRMGAECASIDRKDAARGDAERNPAERNSAERRQTLDSLLLPQDAQLLEDASRIDRSIHDCEEEVKKLEAALAIDDEKAKIEKFRKTIQEKREKIAKAEQDIAEYEEGIRDSEAYIQKLQNLL